MDREGSGGMSGGTLAFGVRVRVGVSGGSGSKAMWKRSDTVLAGHSSALLKFEVKCY